MKKEVKTFRLTDNPTSKKVTGIRLTSDTQYDIEIKDDLWIKENENNQQNNSESIPKLESEQAD